MKIVLCLVLVSIVLSVRPVRRMWLELDPLRRSLLAGLILMIVIGQLVAKKYTTYPFVKWGMYDSHSETVRYFEYRGTRSDGSEAPFPIAHLLRTHSSDRAIECPTCGKRLLWRMRDMGHERRRAERGPERRAIRELYDETLRSAYRVYRERHPEADYERLEVWLARFEVAEYVDRSSIERRKLWSVSLEADAEERGR